MQTRQEIYHTITKFFSEDMNSVNYFGLDDEARELESFLHDGKIHDFDKPDAYVIHGDKILLIEHFRFDSSKVIKRKGSTAAREEIRIGREFDKMMQSQTQHDFFEKNKATISYTNFVKNFIDNFSTHYKKIDAYISNVKGILGDDFPSKVRICFLVEDVTPIPLLVHNNTRIETVIPFYSKDILNALIDSPRVDWLLTSYRNNSSRMGYFFSQKYSHDYLGPAEKPETC